MAHITNPLGRQKVQNPAQGFDVSDGGNELYNALSTMFQTFSDNITTRWLGGKTLAANGSVGDSVLLTHNFTSTLASLKLVFIVGGVVQTTAQVAAKFTVTQTTTDSITVLNLNAGAPVTFDLYVFALKPNIVASDLETAFLASLIDTSTAQTLTAKTLSGAKFLEEASPATPSAGAVAVYAKASDHKLYIKDSTGTETKVGSGSGGGVLSFVKNPDGESSRSLDITYGGGVSAPSDAPTALVGTKSFRLTGAVTASGNTYWQWDCNAIDSFFIGKPLSFSLKTSASVASAFRVSVYNVTNSTELTETQVVIPGGMYEAKGFFIPLAGKAYGLRVTQITNGTNTCDVDDVYVGDVAVRYGQAVTDWKSIALDGLTTNLTGFGSGSKYYYRRVGANLQLYAEMRKDTSAGSGANSVLFTIPDGLIIDTSASGIHYSYLGPAWLINETTTGLSAFVAVSSPTQLLINMPALSRPYYASDCAAQDYIAFRAEIPIVGWSSNVQMADRAVEEYASNSNATNAATDTTSFAYGAAGSLMPNGAVGTAYRRRVQFQSAIQATDSIIVEIDQGGDIWTPSEFRFPLTLQGTNAYGIAGERVTGSSTKFEVLFNAGGFVSNNTTYGGNGAAWSGINAWKWRVRKVSGGAQVGFPISAANIVGQTTAAAAGMIGETKTGTSAGLTFPYGVSTTYGISLEAGTWLLTGFVEISIASAITITGASIIYARNITDSSTYMQSNVNVPAALTNTLRLPVPTSIVVISSTKTIGALVNLTWSAGSLTAGGSIITLTAVRLA